MTTQTPAPSATDNPVYCCYGCSLAAGITQARGEQGEANWLLTRLGVSAFLSMGVMVFSLAMYGQHLYGVALDEAAPFVVGVTGLLRYLSLLLATPVFLLLGLPIVSNAFRQFSARIVSTDALVVLGVAAAFAYSYVSTFTDRGAVYFETACMVLVLVTLGRYLEATGKLKASEAIQSLENLIPDEVTIERHAEKRTVAAHDVQVDDLLLVSAGDRIVADGIVQAGRSHVDEQIVTGETSPVVRDVGDTLRAGSIALDGSLTAVVTAVGSQSTLGRLLALLEDAKQSKGRYERLADRVATVFVPFTIVLAVTAVAVHARRESWDAAILAGLSVLLISCPCALGLATPLAVWVSLGRAAKRGVVFRRGADLEQLACVRAVAFDKTGTLTTGDPTITSFVSRPDDRFALRRVLAIAGGLGATSRHVVAHAIAAYSAGRGIAPEKIEATRTVPGRGLVGSVHGTTVRLGNVTMMDEAGITFNAEMRTECDHVRAAGDGLTCVAWGRSVSGVFAFSETLRPGVKAVIERVRKLGCLVTVLTGDHRQRGEELAETLGVETHAELGPKDKIEHLERLRREVGPTVMVGDGLNDAPALAAADVGMALGCGADLTRESAAVCLLGNDLTMIPWAIRLTRETLRTIKINLFWAFFYNLIGLSLAVAGKLNPVLAALAMVVSSVFVVTNSLRLGHETGGDKQRDERERENERVPQVASTPSRRAG